MLNLREREKESFIDNTEVTEGVSTTPCRVTPPLRSRAQQMTASNISEFTRNGIPRWQSVHKDQVELRVELRRVLNTLIHCLYPLPKHPRLLLLSV